uniref:Uncharacterized protein n=1 Tax=Lepeophtheirus salmonis TaxID=72036 RepID=A0A0K2T5A5_LEPSM
MIWDTSLAFDHDLCRLSLTYLIHFSSTVTIRFRNGSIFFRLSSDSQMEIHSLFLHPAFSTTGQPVCGASFTYTTPERH